MSYGGPGSGIGRIISASGARVEAANTGSPQTLASVTVPGGVMGKNGWLELRAAVSRGVPQAGTVNWGIYANSPGPSFLLLGSVSFDPFTLDTQSALSGRLVNQNSESSGIAVVDVTYPYFPPVLIGFQPNLGNTALPFPVSVRMQKSIASDQMFLEYFHVVAYYSA